MSLSATDQPSREFTRGTADHSCDHVTPVATKIIVIFLLRDGVVFLRSTGDESCRFTTAQAVATTIGRLTE